LPGGLELDIPVTWFDAHWLDRAVGIPPDADRHAFFSGEGKLETILVDDSCSDSDDSFIVNSDEDEEAVVFARSIL
jgi:hypothetical protein